MTISDSAIINIIFTISLALRVPTHEVPIVYIFRSNAVVNIIANDDSISFNTAFNFCPDAISPKAKVIAKIFLKANSTIILAIFIDVNINVNTKHNNETITIK